MITYYEEIPDEYLKLADALVKVDKVESGEQARSYLKNAHGTYIKNHVTQRAELAINKDPTLGKIIDLENLAYSLGRFYSADKKGSYYIKLQVYALKKSKG